MPDCLRFRQWFEAASSRSLDLPDESLRAARELGWVFVGGLHNELMPGYFRGNITELESLGVPANAIRVLQPSTRADLASAARSVDEALVAIATRIPRKIVVVAHSRGACATLAAALSDSLWFQQHVQALFLVQGPFGGTLLADRALGFERRSLRSRSFSPRHRLAASAIELLERLVLRVGMDRGLHELSRQASALFWSSLTKRASVAVSRIEPITYFISSAIDPARLRYPRSSLGFYLREGLGPNDGIVGLRDQWLEGIGTRVEPLEAGHTDLVWGLFPNRGTAHHQAAFVQSLIMLLHDRATAQGLAVAGDPVNGRDPSIGAEEAPGGSRSGAVSR